MSRLLVKTFSISIDGYGAGLRQDLQNPLGVGGPELFDWFFHTRTWRQMHGLDAGETGIDDNVAAEGFVGVGSWILGRNMFGPVRGAWPDESWKGWWGDEPPYHTPVFVLTHHASPAAFMPPWNRRRMRQAASTSGSVAASPRFGSICRLDSSTNCVSRSRRSCSVVANIF
jgi:dihydrofolate reductase